MEIAHLFPTPIGMFRMSRPFTDQETQFVLSAQPRQANRSNHSSVNSYLLNAPELSSIREFVDACTEQYAREVWCVQESCTVSITQSWSNYTAPGGSHHQHHHGNSLFSGVLYLQTDSVRDKLYFYRNDNKALVPEYTQENLYNSYSWWLPAETGTLLLFPSLLSHSVQQVGSGVERCSIAFNTFPYGVLGSPILKTELKTQTLEDCV